jgi:hypothetical protein
MNAVSIHEGFPIMNGYAMQKFNEGDALELRALMPMKMKEIQKRHGTVSRSTARQTTRISKVGGI